MFGWGQFEKLVLPGNSIDDQGARQLTLSRSIRSLFLDYNGVGVDGAQALFGNVKMERHLLGNRPIEQAVLADLAVNVARARINVTA